MLNGSATCHSLPKRRDSFFSSVPCSHNVSYSAPFKKKVPFSGGTVAWATKCEKQRQFLLVTGAIWCLSPLLPATWSPRRDRLQYKMLRFFFFSTNKK